MLIEGVNNAPIVAMSADGRQVVLGTCPSPDTFPTACTRASCVCMPVHACTGSTAMLATSVPMLVTDIALTAVVACILLRWSDHQSTMLACLHTNTCRSELYAVEWVRVKVQAVTLEREDEDDEKAGLLEHMASASKQFVEFLLLNLCRR